MINTIVCTNCFHKLGQVRAMCGRLFHTEEILLRTIQRFRLALPLLPCHQ